MLRACRTFEMGPVFISLGRFVVCFKITCIMFRFSKHSKFEFGIFEFRISNFEFRMSYPIKGDILEGSKGGNQSHRKMAGKYIAPATPAPGKNLPCAPGAPRKPWTAFPMQDKLLPPKTLFPQ